MIFPAALFSLNLGKNNLSENNIEENKIMNKTTRKVLKKKILQNFIKLIESKPELMDDIDLKDAYINLKSKLIKK